MKSNVYLKSVIDAVPRLLCLIDRNPASETYGCCDRTYWHYRTVDFPSARSQEAALTLALLYSASFEGNPYFRNAQVLEWCRAAMAYWAAMQEPNGSFNEWYPKENSFVATAFSSCAVAESLLLLKDFSFPERKLIVSCLKKSAGWLMARKETRVSNQLSGAALALYNIYLVSGEGLYRRNAEEKVNFLLASQSSEGWWKEYTGPDVGYLSLMASYLTKYAKKSGRKDVSASVIKALGFLCYFIHPDLTVGGVYGCRNTAYLIPYCAESFASVSSDAAAIASHIRESISKQVTVSPISLDDRYLAYTGYEWLQAGIVASSLPKSRPRFSSSFERNFSEANLYVRSTQDYYLIVNYAKGGAFFLALKRAKSSFADSGAIVRSAGKAFGSGCVTSDHKPTFSNGELSVSGPLYELKSRLPSFGKVVLLRVFQALVGRYAAVGLLLKKFLRDVLITEAKPSSLAYSRKFVFSGRGIVVVDEAKLPAPDYSLVVGVPASFIYVPSTNYFEVPLIYSSAVSSAVGVIKRRFLPDGRISAE